MWSRTKKNSGKISLIMVYQNNKQKMELLITQRTKITSLLEMDWMKTFKLTIGRIRLAGNNESKKENVQRDEKLEKLLKSQHLEKIKDYDKDCFVWPVVLTVESDKSKNSTQFQKIKRGLHQNETTYGEHGRIGESDFGRNNSGPKSTVVHFKIELDYAYGQLKLLEGTSRQCVF